MFFYFYVIVENGKTIQLYQTIKCINLIFLIGIDTLFKMYQSNLKDYCDTETTKIVYVKWIFSTLCPYFVLLPYQNNLLDLIDTF